MVALGYPESPDAAARDAYRRYFESLEHVLPCATCQRGYGTLLAAMPINDVLDSREDLFRWTVDLHNEVGKKLGKPHMTAQFVREKYIFGLETLKPARVSGGDPRTAYALLGAVALLTVAAFAYGLFGRKAEGRGRRR